MLRRCLSLSLVLVLAACNRNDERVPRLLAAGELGQEAMRKMNKEDGAGCLAALDQARGLDARTEAMFAHVRAQCEMLTGRCQDGKKRLDAYYSEATNMPPEMRARSIDSVCSMWCRGGDMDNRDRVNQAIFELSQAAYSTKKDTRYCQERLDLAMKLLPEVKPAEFGDETLKTAPNSIHIMAAQCMARAGDCAAAFKAYSAEESVIARNMRSVPMAPEAKDKAIRDAFLSSISGCSSAE